MALKGNPNKFIDEIGIRLMLDEEFQKLLFYADKLGEENKDLSELEPLEDAILQLKDKYFFFNRRVNKVFLKAGASAFIRLGEFEIRKGGTLDETYIEIGIVCHEKYLETPNGNRLLCLIDVINRVLTESNISIGNVITNKVYPIRDLPTEYEGFLYVSYLTGYNSMGLNM